METRLTTITHSSPIGHWSVSIWQPDPRLAEMVFRYRARNFPATLSDDEQVLWEEHRAAMLHGGRDGRLTVAGFFERIDTLAEQADERGQQILEALYDWAEGIAPEA